MALDREIPFWYWITAIRANCGLPWVGAVGRFTSHAAWLWDRDEHVGQGDRWADLGIVELTVERRGERGIVELTVDRRPSR